MSAPVSTAANVVPIFIRLPKNGRSCPYSQLSRTMLDQLTRPQKSNNFKPPVASKVLRAGGSQAGIRLIKLASLITYLNSLPAERPKPKVPKSKARACLRNANEHPHTDPSPH